MTILPNFFARKTLVGNVCWPTCSKTTSTSLPPVSSRTRLPNLLQASIRALFRSGVSGGLYIRSAKSFRSMRAPAPSDLTSSIFSLPPTTAIGFAPSIRQICTANTPRRPAAPRPDAVEVPPGAHHQHQRLVRPDRGDLDLLQLHGGVRVPFAIGTDAPGEHLLRQLADVLRDFTERKDVRHVEGSSCASTSSRSVPPNALGWRKPTLCPRAPGRPTLSIRGTPRASRRLSTPSMSFTRSAR